MKTIKKGDYTIEHFWYLDNYGFTRNAINIKLERNGTKVSCPIMCPPRAVNSDSSDAYSGDSIEPFTEEGYKIILMESINKYSDEMEKEMKKLSTPPTCIKTKN